MKEIDYIEFRSGTHLEANFERKDINIVSELVTYKDGTSEKKLKILENYERPFFVTKPFFRNHKQKKESEPIDNLDKFTSTDSDLANNAAARLGMVGYRRNNMRDVVNNPYLYLGSTTALTILKYGYKKKYPDRNTPFSICVLDIESDVDTGVITVITVTMKDIIYTVATENYMHNVDKKTLEEKLDKSFKENVPIDYPNLKRKIDIVKNSMEGIERIFKLIHILKPDILTAWNILFDFGKIADTCRSYNVDPKDIFSDPTLPSHLRSFKIKEGPKKKLTESGKERGIDQHEQWHTIITPAHYYIIDAMTAYHFIRMGEKTIAGGFSLNNVLNKVLNLEKLKFKHPEAEGLTNAEWHRYMSKNHPIDYLVYNQWDVLSMLELDSKTKDLSISLPLLSINSTFDKFNSGPKKLMDDFFIYFLEQNRILGTSPRDYGDLKGLGLDAWIVTLSSWRTTQEGMCALKGHPTIHTNVRPQTLDLDIVSSYPSFTVLLNISKATTKKEILKIGDMPKELFKNQNMNLITGRVNAISYCANMFNFPTLSELDKKIQDKKKEKFNTLEAV